MIIADELIVKRIPHPPKIDKHAKQRAEERYGMLAKEFGDYVMQNHTKFEYVTVTYGYGGRPSRMFIYEGRTFIFRMYENYLQTTFPANGNKAEQFTQKVSKRLKATLNEELQKYERQEVKLTRELERFRAELEREIADIRVMITKVRSTAKLIAYRARMVALELRIAEIPEEIAKVQIDKMRKVQALVYVAKGVVS